MSALFARLDRFVRWFFNSSPTDMAIEPKVPPPAVAPAPPRQTFRGARSTRRRQDRGQPRHPTATRAGAQPRGRYVA
ncbi:MAG: hypothetical protein ACXWJA_15505 [Caldimonas sp.]